MLLWRIILALFFAYEATGFQSQKIFSSPISGDTSVKRASPLKTAGGNGNLMYSFIPRLEPGLRILHSSKFLASFDPQEISAASLNLMSKLMMKRDGAVLSKDDFLAMQRDQNRVSMEMLFATAKNSLATFSMRFYSFVKKLVATSVLLAGGAAPKVSIPPVAMIRSATIASASVAATLIAGPKRIAHAAMASLQLLGHRQYQSLSATQRLGTTPVYFVANARGNAFLQEDLQSGTPEQKIIVYFMSSEDANDYLEEMAQSNPANAQEFHLVTTTLEKVVDTIASKKQSRKLGRYPMDVINRIQPSSRQVENAAMLLNKAQQSPLTRAAAQKQLQKQAPVSIPMFSAPGLIIKRASGELVTPYYFAMEDLQDDWEKMVQEQKNTNVKISAQPPQILVRDFTEVMCLAQGISQQYVEGKDLSEALETLVKTTKQSNAAGAEAAFSVKEIKSALETPGVIAPRREVEMIKRYYRQQQGFPGEFSRAKLTVRPE